MAWKTLDDYDIGGKVVLTRLDLNVPVKDGQVSDTTRIERAAPTLCEITGRGGRAVILSHFGRPKGAPNPDMSLRIVVPALEAALGRRVQFAADCVGAEAESAIGALADGDVLLLENTRFHREEEANDPDFAGRLAAHADIFCSDAFSAAHRAHASTVGVARLLPSCAGRQMEAELRALEAALLQPMRPVMAIVGGAKISTKITLLENLVSRVDVLVIGGAMANTFLAAQGVGVGRSLVETQMADTAREVAERAAASGCEIILPVDVAVSERFEPAAKRQVVAANAVPADTMILDAGPETAQRIKDTLDRCKTLVWNGPLGAFEMKPFDAATVEVARYAAERTAAGHIMSVGGGGDTVAALNAAGVVDRFTYVSTAGGAFLEWLEGRTLPGVEVLATPPTS